MKSKKITSYLNAFVASEIAKELTDYLKILNTSTLNNHIDTYEKCLNEIVDIIGCYNYKIEIEGINIPLIKLVVDDEKTASLRGNSEFKIYKVVQIK